MEDSRLFLPPEDKIIKLEPQYEFPDIDLSPSNTAMLKYILEVEQGIEVQGSALQEDQRPVYEIAHTAAKLLKLETINSKDEYDAFTGGFSSHEAISMLVEANHLTYDESTAQLQAMRILLRPERGYDGPESALSEVYSEWTDTHPNTLDVIHTSGEVKEESENQIRMRTFGACVSHILQSRNFLSDEDTRYFKEHGIHWG